MRGVTTRSAIPALACALVIAGAPAAPAVSRAAAVPALATVQAVAPVAASNAAVAWGRWPATDTSAEPAQAIAAGSSGALVLRRDGTLVNWGGGNRIPPGVDKVVAIASGESGDVALRGDGTVLTWASGLAPIHPPAGLSGVVAVAAGSRHAIALKSDGTIVGWGDARVPRGLRNVSAISVSGSNTVALRRDGTVVAWGSLPPPPTGLKNVVAVSAGPAVDSALQTNGTVVAWGCPAGVRRLSVLGAVSLASDSEQSYALRRDGTVVSWQVCEDTTAYPVAGLRDIAAISVSKTSLNQVAVALTRHGGVVNFTEFSDTPSPQPFANLADVDNGIAVTNGGVVRQWGMGIGFTFGGASLAGLAGVKSVAAGDHHVVALMRDGTVKVGVDQSDGTEKYFPPPGLDHVVDVDAGSDHTIALRADGNLVQWGITGLGGKVPDGLRDVIAISASGRENLALTRDGTVASWGSVGLAPPAGLSGIVAIAAGGRTDLGLSHALALRADGTVFAWGDNRYGQVTVPAGLRDVTAIAAGAAHSLALRSDGTVVEWGAHIDYDGQVVSRESVPTELSHVTAIRAFDDMSVAITSMPVPTQPRSVSVRRIGFAIEVRWLPPVNGSTANVSGYAVRIQPANIAVALPASARHYRVPWTASVASVTAMVSARSVAGPGPAVTVAAAARIAVYRPSTGQWYVKGVGIDTFGGEVGDVPVPGDYDGDGTVDLAVYNTLTATWNVRGQEPVPFGRRGDQPAPGDYAGTGRLAMAVAREFARAGDVPVPRDYAGYGWDDRVTFHPATGGWYFKYEELTVVAFGRRGDRPVPADYDGDGHADLAVFRPASGTWHVRGARTVRFGRRGDVPVPADYDGDGKADIAVFRPSSGTWYIRGMGTVRFGQRGDVPVRL